MPLSILEYQLVLARQFVFSMDIVEASRSFLVPMLRASGRHYFQHL